MFENLIEFCRSESLSEKGLREIIGLHDFNNDPNIKSYRFFRSACHNERVTEGVLRYLLKYFPAAVRHTDSDENLPLHYLCNNKNVTLGMVQLLIDAFPESLRHEDDTGWLPLHELCNNENLNEEVGLEILKGRG
jgi:ankyrin repeat protein